MSEVEDNYHTSHKNLYTEKSFRKLNHWLKVFGSPQSFSSAIHKVS